MLDADAFKLRVEKITSASLHQVDVDVVATEPAAIGRQSLSPLEHHRARLAGRAGPEAGRQRHARDLESVGTAIGANAPITVPDAAWIDANRVLRRWLTGARHPALLDQTAHFRRKHD